MKHFRGARAYAFDPVTRTYHRESEFLIDGGRFVTFVSGQIGGGHDVVELEEYTVVPAFSDCHVHMTDTGYVVGKRDFSAVHSLSDFREAIAALPREDAFLLAANYDDSAWLDGALATADALEGPFADTHAMLVRVDGHSCIVNKKTLAWLSLDPATEGIERRGGLPTGRLFLDANWRAQKKFLAAIPLAERRASERRATNLALQQGALHLHAQLVGFDGEQGYASEIAALRDLPPARWYPKICEPNPALARSLGLPFVGGDVFLDGSIGSATAAVDEPYASVALGAAERGRLVYDDATVQRYFAEAERLGVSAGVHAIGDRAIEQCVTAWERVLCGRPSAKCRHFIEHFEIATKEQIARCAQLGLFLSMQPQFDAQWGGSQGMYERRLGAERARSMNALRSILRAGATLCGGDDSPVCPLSPLKGMRAACTHHTAEERLTSLEALTMYTYDAARLGHAETHTGTLRAGYDADFVILNRDPFVDGSFDDTHVIETWSRGVRVWPPGGS